MTERLDPTRLAETLRLAEQAGAPNLWRFLDRLTIRTGLDTELNERADLALKEFAHLLAEVDRLTQALAGAYRSREALDCRFAGQYAEFSGSHCPLDKPCARCNAESALAAVTAERDEAIKVVEIARALRYTLRSGYTPAIVNENIGKLREALDDYDVWLADREADAQRADAKE